MLLSRGLWKLFLQRLSQLSQFHIFNRKCRLEFHLVFDGFSSTDSKEDVGAEKLPLGGGVPRGAGDAGVDGDRGRSV